MTRSFFVVPYTLPNGGWDFDFMLSVPPAKTQAAAWQPPTGVIDQWETFSHACGQLQIAIQQYPESKQRAWKDLAGFRLDLCKAVQDLWQWITRNTVNRNYLWNNEFAYRFSLCPEAPTWEKPDFSWVEAEVTTQEVRSICTPQGESVFSPDYQWGRDWVHGLICQAVQACVIAEIGKVGAAITPDGNYCLRVVSTPLDFDLTKDSVNSPDATLRFFQRQAIVRLPAQPPRVGQGKQDELKLTTKPRKRRRASE
jgi:hypothetical protein